MLGQLEYGNSVNCHWEWHWPFCRIDTWLVATLHIPPRFFLYHPAGVAADILPLFVHLNATARQVAKLRVHVIGERLASLAN